MNKLLTTAASAAVLFSGAAFAAETVTAQTTGMTCEECAGTVKARLMKNETVETVAVDIETGTVIVTVKDGATFSDEDMEAAIDWAGYDITDLSRSET